MPIVPPTRPPYKNVPTSLGSLVGLVLLRRPGSLEHFADALFAGVAPAPRIAGTENIPPRQPFVLVFNHYESASAPAWWGPLLIARVVARAREREQRHVHFLMTREWWYPPGLGRWVKQPFTHWFFSRLSQGFDLVLVPPVLDGDVTRGEGVAGVRQALELARGDHPQLVGLAPEGHAGPGGTLKIPPPGVGLFMLLLTHDRIPCLPAAWFRDHDGALVVRFAAPFMPRASRELPRAARDRAAANQVMQALAELLPPALRGAYAAPCGTANEGRAQ